MHQIYLSCYSHKRELDRIVVIASIKPPFRYLKSLKTVKIFMQRENAETQFDELAY